MMTNINNGGIIVTDAPALCYICFCCIGLLPILPLGKLSLPFFPFKKFLHLRKQNTGQGLHLVTGYPGTVVNGVLRGRCDRPASRRIEWAVPLGTNMNKGTIILWILIPVVTTAAARPSPN